MRKLFIILLIIALVTPVTLTAHAFPARPTTAGFVFDYENVIEDDVEQELNEAAQLLQNEGVMELFLITVSSIGDMEPYEYGLRFFREWGIGDAEKNNGMVIFATTDMGKGNNVVRISTGYGLEGDYPDGKTGELLDTYMIPHFAKGDYSSAFANVVDAILVNHNISHNWETVKIDGELSLTMFITIIAVLLSSIFIALYFFFRFLQKLFFKFVLLVFKKDIRTKGYLKHEQRVQLKKHRRAAYAAAGYDDSGSTDSYSGGGGDSGGGGSDRSF